MSEEHSLSQPIQDAHAYHIRVEGRLDERWSGWFNGLVVRLESVDPPVTSLSGPVVDQASLRGILIRIWNLNLTLISVNRVEDGSLLPVQNPISDTAEGY
jgi:hypothetical protein